MDNKRPFLLTPNENALDDDKSLHWTQWKDVGWYIVFLIHILVTVGFALSYGIMALESAEPKNTVIKSGGTKIVSNVANDSALFMIGFTIVLLIAAASSISWVYLMSRLASRMILISFLIIIILSLLSGLLLCATGYITGGYVFIFLFVSGILFFISIRKYIDFAAAVLTIACDAIIKLPGTVLCSALLLGLQTLWVIFWVMAVVGLATNEATSRLKFRNTYYRTDECSTYTYSTVSGHFIW